MKRLLFLLLLPSILLAQRKQGNPLDSLPLNMEVLAHFGERADFSPDNQRVAFMDKSFGDAFVIDLKTRIIRCLTCNIPGAAFLRVMHLANGDYILIGPEKFIDPNISRERDNELWYLSTKPGSKPIRLNERMHEGAAISKRSMLLSFSETSGDHPEFPKDYSRLMVSEIDLSGPTPSLIHVHKVYESFNTRLQSRSSGFLRQRHENDIHLLCEKSRASRRRRSRKSDGNRFEDRKGHRFLTIARYVQRMRRRLP